MIDIHCHINPGLDDGPKDFDTSIEMIKLAEDNGIKKIIATAHYYKGCYEECYEKIEKSVQALNEAATNNKFNIEIYPGQEVLIDNYTVNNYREGIIRGLNNSRYLLIEFPMNEIPENALDIIYELKLLGVIPILAHPERYTRVIGDITKLNPFIGEGLLFQVNTGSIKGLFGSKVQNTALTLVKEGLCDFIASDAHTTRRRIPELLPAIKEINNYNKNFYEEFNIRCNSILYDIDINVFHKKLTKKKSFFSFLKR